MIELKRQIAELTAAKSETTEKVAKTPKTKNYGKI